MVKPEDFDTIGDTHLFNCCPSRRIAKTSNDPWILNRLDRRHFTGPQAQTGIAGTYRINTTRRNYEGMSSWILVSILGVSLGLVAASIDI
ncbi:hypothetical protein HK100_007023, partial [Physocladia obscura]